MTPWMRDGTHLHKFVEDPFLAAVLGAAVKADRSLADHTAADKQGRRAIDHAHPDCMLAMRAAGPYNNCAFPYDQLNLLPSCPETSFTHLSRQTSHMCWQSSTGKHSRVLRKWPVHLRVLPEVWAHFAW